MSRDLKFKMNPQVLVVGAGVAGLAAAQELAARKISSVVLEARHRIGGRAWTDFSLGVPLDMGASWIHGIRGNPIYELARQHDIKTVQSDYSSATVFDADGARWDAGRSAQVEAWFDEFLSRTLQAAAERRAQKLPDISLGQFLEQFLRQGDPDPAMTRAYKFLVSSHVEHEFGADVGDLSLMYANEGGDEIRGTDVVFPDGYIQIVERLAQGLDIRLEHIVERVEYDESGVRVTTNRSVFHAARVLITLPLGVLKKGAVEFSPALPHEKQDAIRKLGMGILNKVYLKFERAFWAGDDTDLIGYVSPNYGEWAEILNLYKYTGAPVLLLFNAGTFGAALEKFSDQEISARAMQALRKMYGNQIPEPDGYSITRWRSDPFALGSYSYMAVGATPAERDVLAAPIGERVFFAGEATNAAFPSTVHGAYLSGLREAQRIAALHFLR